METIKTISLELAAVHAYLCADGYVVKNKPPQKQKFYRLALRNTQIELLEDFNSSFFSVFKKSPLLSKGLDRSVVNSKELYYYFTKKFGSFYSSEWRMPSYPMSESALACWLRAFFDCEAWLELQTRKNRAIHLQCINLQGLKQVKKSLRRLKITSKIKKVNKRNIYCLSVFGRGNLIKFQEKINFLHPRKKQKLQEVLRDFEDYNWVLPDEPMALLEWLCNRIKTKNSYRIRVCSKKRKNLVVLKRALARFFDIYSRISNSRFNGYGARYFELVVSRKKSLDKLKKLLNSQV